VDDFASAAEVEELRALAQRGTALGVAVFPLLVWLIIAVLFKAWITKIVTTFFVVMGAVSSVRRPTLARKLTIRRPRRRHR